MVSMTSSWEAVGLFCYPRSSSKVVIAMRTPNSSTAGVSCRRRLDHLPGWCCSSALEHRCKAWLSGSGSVFPKPVFLVWGYSVFQDDVWNFLHTEYHRPGTEVGQDSFKKLNLTSPVFSLTLVFYWRSKWGSWFAKQVCLSPRCFPTSHHHPMIFWFWCVVCKILVGHLCSVYRNRDVLLPNAVMHSICLLFVEVTVSKCMSIHVAYIY